MKRRLRVGVFDSGIGGLPVLHACMNRLPDALFYYYGDNENAPYGSRSEGEIRALVRKAFLLFRACKVDAAVLACNTATAVCAEDLRAEFDFPVIGMEPAVRPAARICKNVLVLCTPRTAESARLQALLANNPDCRITVHAAPRLAGAIERALTRNESLSLAEHLPQGAYDGVVLGCTHYSFFSREIATFYHCRVFDGNAGTANRLASLTEQGKIGQKSHNQPRTKTNKCFTNFCKKRGIKGVIFLGKSNHVNKKTYKQTFVSKKSKKFAEKF